MMSDCIHSIKNFLVRLLPRCIRDGLGTCIPRSNSYRRMGPCHQAVVHSPINTGQLLFGFSALSPLHPSLSLRFRARWTPSTRRITTRRASKLLMPQPSMNSMTPPRSQSGRASVSTLRVSSGLPVSLRMYLRCCAITKTLTRCM